LAAAVGAIVSIGFVVKCAGGVNWTLRMLGGPFG
jgi:hypothetical protein